MGYLGGMNGEGGFLGTPRVHYGSTPLAIKGVFRVLGGMNRLVWAYA